MGYLNNTPRATQNPAWLEAFRNGLRQAGYVEGQNLIIDDRWADNQVERLPDLAAELVQIPVDVILTSGTPQVQAAQRTTSTIPIVMAIAGDPVGLGIITSLARPGGNVTGLTTLAPELSPKRLQLLRETAPGIDHIGIMGDLRDPGRGAALRETENSAHALGLQTMPLDVRDPGAVPGILSGAVIAGVDSLVVLQGGSAGFNAVVQLIAQHRLPAMYDGGSFTEAGGLMFYGVSFVDLFRKAAVYVDRILKGASPAELPVDRPTTFDFVVNLKTAQELGLTVPPGVLAQATEVIQ